MQHYEMRVCSVHGCPTIYPATEGTRCAAHRKQADVARGRASARGYYTQGHKAFRTAVLTRDPICVICHARFSTIADHHPNSRRDLITQGLDPNNPARGRGLCKPCHDKATARHQPGGWNRT